jgi:ABC-2 type transport system ATP-binding protein
VGEKTRIDLTLNAEAPQVVERWRTVPGVSTVHTPDGVISVLVDDSNRVLPRLFETAVELGARITAVEIQEPNLEAVFLHLTGKALRD